MMNHHISIKHMLEQAQSFQNVLTRFGETNFGFWYRVGPPKLPLNMRIGLSTIRGPETIELHTIEVTLYTHGTCKNVYTHAHTLGISNT